MIVISNAEVRAILVHYRRIQIGPAGLEVTAPPISVKANSSVRTPNRLIQACRLALCWA
jgi:hypothetical protein